MRYRVSELAKRAGVSVRTLHHYDRIGLLVPDRRPESDYREYSAAHEQRLGEILAYRALGFALAEIGKLLDNQSENPAAQYRRQLETVEQHLQRLERIRDQLLEALSEETSMSGKKIIKALDGFDPDQYAEEAEQRWGETAAYQESARRTKGYRPDQWQQLKAEQQQLESDLAELLRQGQPATGEAAMSAAEGLRRHIDRWFYPCSHQMHANLGEMYCQDPRFQAHYDEQASGLAEYVRDAIVANALRQP